MDKTEFEHGDGHTGTESANTKRGRKVLSLRERIEVIKIAEKQRDTRELAERFKCGRTQILSILSQKERLLKEWANNGDPNRLRRRPSLLGIKTNRVIFEWISRCQRAGIPLSEENILEKANKAKRFFQYGEFRPNRRWLDRFKRKFRLNVENLAKPDPMYYDGVERSLELKDIYEDIRENIIDSKAARNRKNRADESTDREMEDSLSYDVIVNNEAISDSMDVFEIQDSEEEDNSNVHEKGKEEYTKNVDVKRTMDENGIVNDQEALEYLKKLEEYAMLKDNFRAIGLIDQLERIYQGLIDS